VGALPEEDKPRLFDEQKSLKDAQATWGGTLGVLSALGMALSPVVAAVPFAVGSVAVAVLKRKQNAVERVLADPPRFDYETATRAHRRRYIPGVLGDDRLAVATDQAAVATLRATAYLEASVRADERSQGARIDGHIDFADWHLEEARHLFELAMKWSGEMAVALNVLALSWAAFAVDSAIDALPLPDDIHAGDFPPEARTTFDRTGLVTDDLDLVIGQPEVRHVLASGPSTVGDVALESAVSTRELSRRVGQVAGGRRALPQRAGVEAAPLSSTAEYSEVLQRGGPEAVKQRLLPAAERGSTDAMFDLGTLSHAKGDRAEARVWLSEAAALSAPLPQKEYLSEVQRLTEYEQLLPPPRQLESPLVARGLVGKPDADRVARYWSVLSENGRKVFRAAAQIEKHRRSSYTLDDIGELLGLPYESVRSMHRSTGRTAKSWRRETGTEEPIRLEAESYHWEESREGNRTSYRLPPGVAGLINTLEDEVGRSDANF
jgi:hypothetical protein